MPILEGGFRVAEVLADAAAPAASSLLQLVMLRQETDRWCWAAVGLSLAQYYGDFSWGDQCALVKKFLACGGDCRAEACRKEGDLQLVLEKMGLLVAPRDPLPLPRFSSIRDELEEGRPLAARFSFREPARRHYFVIDGCREDGSGAVHVADPELGAYWTSTEALRSAYAGQAGSWDTCYWLKAHVRR